MKTRRLSFILFYLITGFWGIQSTNAQGANGSIGADLPFKTYEAEDAVKAGGSTTLGINYMYQRDIVSEASGRRAVELKSTNSSVEFTLTSAAQGLVLRYCIPDASGGGGINETLTMYVNGTRQTINVTSQYAWVYGGYPYDNSPTGDWGNKTGPHRFFDDTRIVLDKEYPSGTKIKFAKESGNNAPYYVIDFLEAEKIPNATTPSGSYTTVSTGGDARAKFISALNSVSNGGTIFLAAGEHNFGDNNGNPIEIKKSVNIVGAGEWHTLLKGSAAAFKVFANNVSFKNFSIIGNAKHRQGNEYGNTAIESDYHTRNMSNLTVENIWIEHMHCGIWLHNMTKPIIQNCRIRNTFADGINFRLGTNRGTIKNNELRNTGDDAIALWSSKNEQNIANAWVEISNNTVGMPSLASGIAVYGGENHTIKNNYIRDIIHVGAGIEISSDHGPTNLNGTITVENNYLVRCGSVNNGNGPIGSIWIYNPDIFNNQAIVNIQSNTIQDSQFQAITIEGNGGYAGTINFLNNKCNGTSNIDYLQGNPYYAIEKTGGGCSGTFYLCGNSFSGYRNDYILRNGFNMTIQEGSGDSCQNHNTPIDTEKPTDNDNEENPGNEDNNPPVGTPDLIVEEITWSPSSPKQGENVTFSAKIKNVGTVATPAKKHGTVWSVNGNVIAWCDNFNSALQPDESVVVTANGGPSGISYWTCGNAATYEITCLTNDDASIEEESNRDNNTLSKTLTVDKSSEPETPSEPGITIKWKQSSGNWSTMAIYAWGASPSGETFGGWPGKIVTEENGWYSVTVPAGQSVGNVIFNNNAGTQFDLNQNISGDICYEITNNSAQAIDCNASVGTPDLIVEEITWNPTSPQSGANVTFSAKIKNVGTAATPTKKHGTIWSVNGNVVAWCDNFYSSLQPGESAVVTANGGPSGISYWTCGNAATYEITCLTNDDFSIPEEINRDNNSLSQTMTVDKSDEVTITVRDGNHWRYMNIYSWGPELHGGWPGVAMTFIGVDADGYGWYTTVIKEASHLVFNGYGEAQAYFCNENGGEFPFASGAYSVDGNRIYTTNYPVIVSDNYNNYTPTTINEIEEANFHINIENGILTLTNSNNDPIQDVFIVDIHGRTLVSESGIKQTVWQTAIPSVDFIFIKVKTAKTGYSKKIKISVHN